MSETNIRVSLVYGKIVEAMKKKPRYLVMAGGARSSKTYSIIQYIIQRCLEAKKPIKVGIIRAKLTWLKATFLEDFKDIMRDQFGLWNESDFNKSDYYYMLNGSKISFIGLDQEQGFQKVHGFKGDIMFFNECVELDYDSVRQILIRCPGTFFFDFNPNCGQDHWVYSKILTRENAAYIHSTYKDNPFLQQELINEILEYEPTEQNIRKGTADETLWKIYGKGERAVVSGLVFSAYSLAKEFPKDAEKVCYGLDFGFSGDPSACVKVGKSCGELFLEEMFYKKGLTTIINPHNKGQPSIEDELRKSRIVTPAELWCDGERPDSIRDLSNCGFNARASVKGPGSIVYGIQVLKRFKINIVETSMNLIREFNNYKWKVEKSGDPTDVPIDKFNHGIDAARYAVRMKWGEGIGLQYYDSVKVDLMTATFRDA